MTLWGHMVTLIVAVLVAVVPGALLAFVAPPGRYRWVAWAAAPALTLGLTGAAMDWLPALGLPHGAPAVLVAELLLAGAAVVGVRQGPRLWNRLRHREEVPAEPGPRIRLPRRADLAGVTVASAVTVGFGWVMLGRLAMPPGWDAMNLGYFTRRIIEAGSVAIPTVCSTGSTQSVESCAFYPLAANVNWAQAVQLSGGRVSAVMTLWTIVIGPVALVAGIHAAVRLLGGSPVVAACAATAPAFIGPMWISMLIGRVTQQTAPCLVPVTALLVALVLRGRHPVRLGLLAGTAGVGLVLLHTYDVLFLAVLAAAVAVALRGGWRVRGSLLGTGLVAVVTLLALVPVLGDVLGAGAQRAQVRAAMPGRYAESFGYWVTDVLRYTLYGYPAPGGTRTYLALPVVRAALVITVACLVAAPLCLVFRELRWARPWLVSWAVFTALGVWTTASDSSAALAVSALWYGVRERLRDMIFPVYGVLVVAGAVGIGLLARRMLVLLRRLPLPVPAISTRLRLPGAPALAAVAVVAALTGLAAAPASWRPLRIALYHRAPVGPSYDAAFAWLAEHTGPGQVIAYDRNLEYIAWAYADYGVPTLFGIPPLGHGDVRVNYARRWAAFQWLTDYDGVQPAGCDVRDFGVEYVVVGKRRIPDRLWIYHYNRQRLEQSPQVTLVHEVGGIKIYQVTGDGAACSR